MRQPVGEGRAVVEDELVRPVLPRLPCLDRGHEGAVLRPVAQDPLLDLGEARARGDTGGGAALLVGGEEVDLRVGHAWSPCSSDPAVRRGRRGARGRRHPDRSGGHRGTTSLAGRRPRARAAPDRSGPGCDGPTRPVLVRPRGRFFRRLAGDGRVDACGTTVPGADRAHVAAAAARSPRPAGLRGARRRSTGRSSGCRSARQHRQVCGVPRAVPAGSRGARAHNGRSCGVPARRTAGPRGARRRRAGTGRSARPG